MIRVGDIGELYDAVPVLTPDRPKKRQNGRPVQDIQGVMVSKTVRTGGQRSPYGSKQNWDSYEINGSIRRLTPTECARLQGFPDKWTATGHDGNLISDTQRYKCLGNAVTVNVVEAIVWALANSNTNK